MRHVDQPKRTPLALARPLAALTAAVALLLCAANASALDGYADREGVFVGLGFGGGMGAANVDEGDLSSGFDGRQLGPALQGIVGGGISDKILFGAQLNYWYHNAEYGSNNFAHNHSNLMAVGDFFLFEGLYVEGGGGLAYTNFEGERGGTATDQSEMGLALRAGLGFEHFLNGTHAVGLNAGYTRHFYSRSVFDTLGGGFSIRWY